MRENIQTVQPGKYKFINQVIDGMTIQINEVNITFRNPAFHASVQVIHFLVLVLNIIHLLVRNNKIKFHIYFFISSHLVLTQLY